MLFEIYERTIGTVPKMLLDSEWLTLSAEENDNNRYLPIKNCLIMEFLLQSFFNEFLHLPQLRHLLNLKWNIGHKLHGTSLILYQSLSVRGMCKYVKNKRVFRIKVEPMGKMEKKTIAGDVFNWVLLR